MKHQLTSVGNFVICVAPQQKENASRLACVSGLDDHLVLPQSFKQPRNFVGCLLFTSTTIHRNFCDPVRTIIQFLSNILEQCVIHVAVYGEGVAVPLHMLITSRWYSGTDGAAPCWYTPGYGGKEAGSCEPTTDDQPHADAFACVGLHRTHCGHSPQLARRLSWSGRLEIGPPYHSNQYDHHNGQGRETPNAAKPSTDGYLHRR